MTSKHRLILAFAACSIAGAAFAAETIKYIYNARGQLIRVERTGTINNGVTTNYTIDKAENRTNKTTTGSPNPPPP